MRRIVNSLAALFIVFIAGWVVLHHLGIVTLKVDLLETPLGLILTAAALITGSSSVKSQLVKRKAYTVEPKAFVDRESQVEAITVLASKGRSIINVYGITGIGVTYLLQFVSDLFNKQLPLSKRYHYCKQPSILWGFLFKAYYIRIEKTTSVLTEL